MRVSSTFEEVSLEEYRRTHLGLRLDSFSFDWREFFRSLVLTIPLAFLMFPFLETYMEYRICAKSIKEIQEAELRSLKQVKKSYLAATLLNNPNFNS